MTHAVRGFGLAGSLLLASTLAVVPKAQAQSTTAAYVYVQVQGEAGPVYGYRASSTGQLSAISGSPFKPGTRIVGGNSSQFLTMGHTLLHSYAVGSNGAIKSQLSEIPFMNYAGGSCGGTQTGDSGAVLDHSGKYVYVLLQWGGDASCSAYQTYKINSDGSFTFVGDTEENWGDQTGQVNPASVDLPSILGNETFAYADESAGHLASPIGLRRESSGELQLVHFNETDPVLANDDYVVESPDASPTGNYVVFQLFAHDSYPARLGVYSVDSSGNISTTNTSSNMPISSLFISSTSFSPDGAMFVAGGDSGGSGVSGSGIEIYKFNGAAPLTLYKTLLAGTPIDQVRWDSSHHLYAISDHGNAMYVFTVTSTSVTEDAKVSITSPLSLVVVSQRASSSGSCPTPTNPGVIVCSPSPGATVSSPVQISATANVSGGVYRFELWSGSTKLLTVRDSGVMDQSLSLAAGTYHLTFVAYNSSGTHEYNTREITVK